MRDKIKDSEYFSNFIAYETERINKFNIALDKVISQRGADDSGVKSTYSSLFTFNLHKLIAMYSNGSPAIEIKEFFNNVYDAFLKVTNISYSDLILVISFSIIFSQEDKKMELFSIAQKFQMVDSFIELLLSDNDSNTKINPPIEFEKIAPIKNAKTMEEQKKIVKQYLDSWYELNKEAYWFDSHKSKNNTYFGYWSFESAAVVKLLGLDKNNFKENQYFPYDII